MSSQQNENKIISECLDRPYLFSVGKSDEYSSGEYSAKLTLVWYSLADVVAHVNDLRPKKRYHQFSNEDWVKVEELFD